MDFFLRFPGLSGVIVKICDMMGRFVAMGVLTYQTGDIQDMIIYLAFFCQK